MSRVQAQVRGEISVRPCRVGLVFWPDIDAIHRAAAAATTTWGGMYFPFLSPADESQARRLATILAVDVLEAMAEDTDSAALAHTPGFRWQRPVVGAGPFDSPKGLTANRLLGPGWLLDHPLHPHDSRFVIPQWERDDPLAALFTVWFGQHERSTQGTNLVVDLVVHNGEVTAIEPTQPVPSFARHITPIELTALDIDYTGVADYPAFMVLNPHDPDDLMALWNVRACGQPVFPWPRGYEHRVASAAQAWLRWMLDAGQVAESHSRSGEYLGSYMNVITLAEESEQLPDALADLLHEAGVRPNSGPPHRPSGWTGGHPFKTNFSRPFTSALAPGERSIAIPMPSIMAARSRSSPGVVAAHIDIHAELGLGPELTFSVPNVRNLAGLLMSYENIPEAFHRPTSSGRVLGVRADSHDVRISPVPPEAVFKQLINGPGWSCQQGENGRFVSRLIGRFGGRTSTAGNQPAIAAILDEAARSPHGLPLPRLIQAARDHQGGWPRLGGGESYPKRMVYELLRRKLLLPGHRIKCPACGTEITVRPEDLAIDLTCEMCSEAFPLGFALGVKGSARNDWVYRLAGNVSVERIREVMPIMATFATLSMSDSEPSTLPHILGLEVSGPQNKCEIDLVLCLDDRGIPVVVIGEIKSYRDVIDATDVANLHRVQHHLRSTGIECVILVATGRESLTDEERTTLRSFCRNLPNPLHRDGFVIPLMPIVLTGQDLSAPPHTEQHPQAWPSLEGWRGVVDLAAESCHRNLGEFQAAETDTGTWQLTWPETPRSTSQ